MAAVAPGLTREFVQVTKELNHNGAIFADMRRAGPLELQQIVPAANRREAPDTPPALRYCEATDPLTRRQLDVAAPGESQIIAFLDGSQRTVAAWRFGVVPIYATVVAAAILLRDDTGHVRIADGSLRMVHRWLIPRCSTDPAIVDLVDRIEAVGGQIVDPLAARCFKDEVFDHERYANLLGNYPELVNAAYDAAGQVRADTELELLDAWPEFAPSPDDWLVVDGTLPLTVPRTIGLVKAESHAQLTGEDALQLYDLPPGHRTTAFQPTSRWPRVSAASKYLSQPAAGNLAPLVWYVRMHDATGLDARHGIVRLEIASDDPTNEDSDRLDEISSWILSERSPRATSDARWGQLLYPIHLLEEMLKRYISGQTRAWPNAG